MLNHSAFRRLLMTGLQVLLFSFFLSGHVFAADNTAPAFSNGKVTTDIGSDDSGYSVAVQSDGKILVAGESDGNFAVTRYNANGSLDTTFNGTGKVTTNFGGSETGYAVALQPDGKILVAGESDGNFAVTRYNANGSLDTTFNGTGKVTTNFGGSETGYAVALQPDGKIVVAGIFDYDFGVARYNNDGSLDTSFNGTGRVTTDVAGSGSQDFGFEVALQPDGKIVVAGITYNSDWDFALARYNANGSLDTSFNGTGKVTTDIGSDDSGYSVAVQSDGKIVVAGSSDGNFAVTRYNANGSLDTTFNGTGKVTTSIGSFNGGNSVALQPDGKILVAGQAYYAPPGADIAVVRYNADGSLDTSFNGTGKVTTDFGSSDIGWSVTLQADGKIVVAGRSYNGINGDFAVARYTPDGVLDISFGTSFRGLALSYTEDAAAVQLEPNLAVFDAELSATGNYSGLTLTLARRGGANDQDVFSALSPLGALTEGSVLTLSGTIIGTVTQNSVGTLRLAFNNNATQDRLNQAVRAIAYRNSSQNPPASVILDWVVNDGNTGAQGTGGALSSTGTTMVSIIPSNDPPTGTNSTLAIPFNGTHVFGLAEFGFNDAEDGTTLSGVRINTLPSKGSLRYDGAVMTAGITLTATDISGGHLSYQPAASESGEPYSSFSFSVKDSVGAYSTSSNTLTFNVIAHHGTVGFANTSGTISEGAADTVELVVQRTGGTDGPVSLSFATSNGTALAPGDYTATSGNLTWLDGDDSSKSIIVQIIDDNEVEVTEAFGVTLSNPTGGATLGASTSIVSIQDNDIPGVLSFSTGASTVREGKGDAILTVIRSNGAWGAASVNYATANGTALAGSDFAATSGTLIWAAGDGASKTITIPIADDGVREDMEQFVVTLSGAVGATLGSTTSHTVTIRDAHTGLPIGVLMLLLE